MPAYISCFRATSSLGAETEQVSRNIQLVRPATASAQQRSSPLPRIRRRRHALHTPKSIPEVASDAYGLLRSRLPRKMSQCSTCLKIRREAPQRMDICRLHSWVPTSTRVTVVSFTGSIICSVAWYVCNHKKMIRHDSGFVRCNIAGSTKACGHLLVDNQTLRFDHSRGLRQAQANTSTDNPEVCFDVCYASVLWG